MDAITVVVACVFLSVIFEHEYTISESYDHHYGSGTRSRSAAAMAVLLPPLPLKAWKSVAVHLVQRYSPRRRVGAPRRVRLLVFH